jgi:hypothetical protein
MEAAAFIAIETRSCGYAAKQGTKSETTRRPYMRAGTILVRIDSEQNWDCSGFIICAPACLDANYHNPEICQLFFVL